MEKLEVWFPKLEDMFTVESIHFDVNLVTVEEDDYVFGFDEVIFRCPTGRKDKNNVHVRNGDIIKCLSLDIGGTYDELILVAEYEDGVMNLKGKKRYGTDGYGSIETSELHVMDFTSNLNVFEVVGNMWEHPELLDDFKYSETESTYLLDSHIK